MTLWNPHTSNLRKQVSSTYHTEEDTGSERSSNFSKVTQPITEELGLTQTPMHQTPAHELPTTEHTAFCWGGGSAEHGEVCAHLPPGSILYRDSESGAASESTQTRAGSPWHPPITQNNSLGMAAWNTVLRRILGSTH